MVVSQLADTSWSEELLFPKPKSAQYTKDIMKLKLYFLTKWYLSSTACLLYHVLFYESYHMKTWCNSAVVYIITISAEYQEWHSGTGH